MLFFKLYSNRKPKNCNSELILEMVLLHFNLTESGVSWVFLNLFFICFILSVIEAVGGCGTHADSLCVRIQQSGCSCVSCQCLLLCFFIIPKNTEVFGMFVLKNRWRKINSQ